eukprot:m.17170 g.17170  ORF g.17170 m.17170 type:complete len:139 (+) comp9245_c0_seq1:380-796(+)
MLQSASLCASLVGIFQADTISRTALHCTRICKSLEIELGPPPRPPSPEFTIDEVERDLSACFANLLAPGRSSSRWADTGNTKMDTPPSIRQKLRNLELSDDFDISITDDVFETDDNFMVEDGLIEDLLLEMDDVEFDM